MKICIRRPLAASFALAVVMGISGCEGTSSLNKLTVTGTVTYDGKPVEKGVILFAFGEFRFEGGSNTTGFVRNGKFSVAGVSPGKNCVIVAASKASTGGGNFAPGSVTIADRPKMPDMRDLMKLKMEWEKKKSSDLIPLDAPGNGQTLDIGGSDGTTLEITILKK